MLIDISEEDIGQRIDIFLASYFEEYSRTEIKKTILQKKVFVNGKKINPSYILEDNDKIDFSPLKKESKDFIAQDVPLDIIYEDQKVFVINKKAGVVVHPGAGNWNNTLANGILYHLQKENKEIPERVGIVHRLDKDTSGIIITAKDNETLDFLQKQFQDRKVEKRYYALVKGFLEHKEGVINIPISRQRSIRKKFTISEEGKEAITNYKVLKEFSVIKSNKKSTKISFLEVTPKTGRTHQIRVHLSSIGYPILGDYIYGKVTKEITNELDIKRQMLHAGFLKIEIPDLGMKSFEIPLASDMKAVLENKLLI